MDTKIKNAIDRFDEGFSCSQAVFSAFAETLGIGLETALKISQPFGGGVAQRGETCGAVAGAFLAIGLKYGRSKAEDIQAKEKTYEITKLFIQRFESAHDSILCRELLGYDISNPEEYDQAKREEAFKRLCPKYVETAAKILLDLIDTPV